MEKVTLKSITMRNFRGEKDRTTNFNDGKNTTIMGENGLGKSRHFDAFVWLLFGKDTQDRKDYNIKTLVNGKSIDKVNCEVSCILNVNGEDINLRRVYAEKWVKPRGQVEERFSGNEHELFWNDVPLKVGEYQIRINSIIDDSVFKMITNPLFFATMKWQDQREQLFQLAGTVADHEIASKNPEYAALLDKITGKSLEDFKREISARKRKLKDELGQIQPRIDQTHKLMPENIDFIALEVEIKNLETQIKDIDEAIADKTKAVRLQYEASQGKQDEINERQQKIQQLSFDAKAKAKEDVFEANAKRRSLESNIKITENEISSLERSIQSSERELKALKERIARVEKAVAGKRQEWFDENASKYEHDDACSECKQPLLEEYIGNAHKLFAESKSKKLSEIKQKGIELGIEAEKPGKDIDEVEKVLKTSQNELKTSQNELDNMKDERAGMPLAKESDIKIEESPKCVELSTEIKELKAAIDNETKLIDTIDLQDSKTDISTKLDAAKGELNNRALITKYKAEIKKLEAKGKDISQQIADVEREEYTIQNFTKAKIDECERRINGLFYMVKFKLFEHTIDGNESETCVPLVDGVPFGAANTAGKVNAGLDIINALVKFNGISAPIFIDGRESVNELIQTESQIINLVVSHDKQLIIK